MLSHLLRRPLQVRVGGEVHAVREPRELDRALAAALAPSAVRIATLGALGADELAGEIERAAALRLRCEQALARAPGEGTVAALVSALDDSEITDDHGWRALCATLASLGADGEALQRAALKRLIEYLAATRTLLEALAVRRAAGAGRGRSAEAGCMQRLAFDLGELAGEDAAQRPPEFNRIPKGEALDVPIDRHQSLDLMLARHRFTLVAGAPFLLIDEYGGDLRLRSGKNVVGRGAQCDVVVDESLRAVSRRHLIVEAADSIVRITDISTLGTFLPRVFLDHRLH